MSTNDMLSEFGIDASGFGDVATSTLDFLPTGRTLRFKSNARNDFIGTINGKEVEAYCKVIGYPRLSQIALLRHVRGGVASGGPEGTQMTGMIRPIQVELGFKMPGSGEEITLAEFCRGIINADLASQGAEPMGEDEFLVMCSKMGLPFAPVPSRQDPGYLTMLWQHFSPDAAVATDLKKYFLANGANEEQVAAGTNMLWRVTHPEGLSLTDFEVGRQDRTMSQYHGVTITDTATGEETVHPGQGFLDLIDAVYSNFARGMILRKQRKALRTKLESLDAGSDERIAIEKEMARLQRLSSSWMNSLGGASRRPMKRADGEIVFDDLYDGTQIPCGRFTIIDPETANAEEPKTQEFSLWTNTSTSVGGTAVDTSSANKAMEELEEEAF